MRPGTLAEVMDFVPNVFVFEKDRASRFRAANRALWQLHGCHAEAEMLGKTDHDYHAPELARQYIEEDRWVMESGERVVDRLWLVPGADGRPQWYWSSKLPLRDEEGRVTGLAGVLRPHDEAGTAPGMLHRLTPAIRTVLRDYGEKIRVSDLAPLCGLSVSQFQREFRRLLGMTPSAYLSWVRIQAARQRLSDGEDLLSEIALECGFCDQSHFVKRFRAETGMRPLDYRRKFGR